MDITQYYLNIDAIKLLEKEDKGRIHDYYSQMVYAHSDGRKGVMTSYFNTLYQNGFLVDIRQEKLNEILNEDNSIDN